MPWTLEILREAQAVSTTLSGPMKLVLVKEVAAAALGAAAREGLHRHYSDSRKMEPQLSTMEIHGLPEALGQMGLGQGDKVAIVYSHSSPKAADFHFFETTAQNRGFAVRLFANPEDALAWLKNAG